ncbi:phage holin [Staphylococcus warneri]|uniref:phage holin n=1 Tax=Staphylococcus warneri TaxID=1292 RepID=UPI00066E2916|nr:phage holin [Staphylococcus warneri]MBY6178282.1 phage holin [Staphylococcaceae bacterium DP2N0-1]
MNWKLRLKNKTVLTGLVGALLLFIKQVTELFGLDLTSQLEQASGLIGTILTILAGLGVIVDPTSKGVKDSGIVHSYSKPRDSDNPNEFVQWQTHQDDVSELTPEINKKHFEEFDTSEPFTDDTDEVEFDVADYEYDDELKRGASRYHDDEVLKESEEDGR